MRRKALLLIWTMTLERDLSKLSNRPRRRSRRRRRRCRRRAVTTATSSPPSPLLRFLGEMPRPPRPLLAGTAGRRHGPTAANQRGGRCVAAAPATTGHAAFGPGAAECAPAASTTPPPPLLDDAAQRGAAADHQPRERGRPARRARAMVCVRRRCTDAAPPDPGGRV